MINSPMMAYGVSFIYFYNFLQLKAPIIQTDDGIERLFINGAPH